MKNQKDRNEKVFDIVLEESLDKYAEHITKNEPDYQLATEDEKIIENSKQKIIDAVVRGKTHKRISVKKVLVLAAVIVVIMAVALAVTTSAFRMFLYETYSELTGTILNIGTERTTSEIYSIINFENKDEVIVPGWLPNNMKLIKTTDEKEKLKLRYEGENGFWLAVSQTPIAYNIYKDIETENNQYKTYTFNLFDGECTIVEIISENNTMVYVAYYNSDKTHYAITSNVTQKNFEKVLEYLCYLEE